MIRWNSTIVIVTVKFRLTYRWAFVRYMGHVESCHAVSANERRLKMWLNRTRHGLQAFRIGTEKWEATRQDTVVGPTRRVEHYKAKGKSRQWNEKTRNWYRQEQWAEVNRHSQLDRIVTVTSTLLPYWLHAITWLARIVYICWNYPYIIILRGQQKRL